MSGFAKFIKGVVNFRQTLRADTVKRLEEVKKSGHAAAVLFSCMDARLTPLRYTQALAGDIYVVRNAGNMVPCAKNFGTCGHEFIDSAEPAGLELTLKRGKIKHAIICGHSDCAAMKTLYGLHKDPKSFDKSSPLDHFLRCHGYTSLVKLEQRLKQGANAKLEFPTSSSDFSFKAMIDPEEKYSDEDKLSQINTLQQMEHVTSHGFLLDLLKEKKVDLHAFWFEIPNGEMHMFSKKQERFIVIKEDTMNQLIEEADHHLA